MFRPEYGASGLHTGSSSPGETDPSSRLQDTVVSRRLVNPGQVSGRDAEGTPICFKPRKRVRFDDKLLQIEFSPSSAYHLPRNDHGLNSFVSFLNPQTSREFDINVFRIHHLNAAASKIMAQAVRTHVLSRGLGEGFQSADTPFPVPSPGHLGS